VVETGRRARYAEETQEQEIKAQDQPFFRPIFRGRAIWKHAYRYTKTKVSEGSLWKPFAKVSGPFKLAGNTTDSAFISRNSSGNITHCGIKYAWPRSKTIRIEESHGPWYEPNDDHDDCALGRSPSSGKPFAIRATFDIIYQETALVLCLDCRQASLLALHLALHGFPTPAAFAQLHTPLHIRPFSNPLCSRVFWKFILQLFSLGESITLDVLFTI
jgi:hypothetical protein